MPRTIICSDGQIARNHIYKVLGRIIAIMPEEEQTDLISRVASDSLPASIELIKICKQLAQKANKHEQPHAITALRILVDDLPLNQTDLTKALQRLIRRLAPLVHTTDECMRLSAYLDRLFALRNFNAFDHASASTHPDGTMLAQYIYPVAQAANRCDQLLLAVQLYQLTLGLQASPQIRIPALAEYALLSIEHNTKPSDENLAALNFPQNINIQTGAGQDIEAGQLKAIASATTSAIKALCSKHPFWHISKVRHSFERLPQTPQTEIIRSHLGYHLQCALGSSRLLRILHPKYLATLHNSAQQRACVRHRPEI